MQLFHFTNRRNLRPISVHGLALGDVVTCNRSPKDATGLCGVWLTTNGKPDSQGVASAEIRGERRVATHRLTVEVAPSPKLVRWIEWAEAGNVTFDTLQYYGDHPKAPFWYVLFGVIEPEQIIEVMDLQTGEAVPNWQDCSPVEDDNPGIPTSQRHTWHRKMLAAEKAAFKAKRPVVLLAGRR